MTDRNAEIAHSGEAEEADVMCEECGDAPAAVETWFNGRTLTRLCAPCWEWWKSHGLIEPRAAEEDGGDRA
jgi:hypothetical protein